MKKILFVTGKLAERALRRTLDGMASGFDCEVAVMKITVAALMTPDWIARFLEPPPGTDLILLPGLCQGDPNILKEATGIPVEKGPDDLRDIPDHFGLAAARSQYGGHDIRILAEINNAPLLLDDEILEMARYFRDCGADVIDIGCTPGEEFPRLEEVVRLLRSEGFELSVDTFDRDEIRRAVGAGASWVLSVNGSNLEVARDLGATVVAIPDFDGGLETLEPTIEKLESWGTPYVIDPVLEPIGFGFARSLARYVSVRDRFPEAEILMGIGNLTELTAADSTGINATLIGFCQELGIRQVLTTEVIPWARGAVRELDIARRLMHFAVREQQVPKHLDDRLLTTKDAEVRAYEEEELRSLQEEITDPNFRIFTDLEQIYVFNSERFVRGRNIQAIFDQLGVEEASHAFYLGKELMKASIAVDLGKAYRQEGALDWGYLPSTPQVREEVDLTQRSKRSRRGPEGAEDS